MIWLIAAIVTLDLITPYTAKPQPQQCPARSTGTFPNCVCTPPFEGRTCKAPDYLPPTCPEGYTGTYPHCFHPCPAGEVGTYPNCYVPCPKYMKGKQPNCEPIPCRTGSRTPYEPCGYPDCPSGTRGRYPDCQPIGPTYKPTPPPPPQPSCPDGLHGTPPGCCPKLQYWDGKICKHIPCPIGWDGPYQPNCTIKVTCPVGQAGEWPDCQYIYCPEGTRGTYPPKCCPIKSIGEWPECAKTAATSMEIIPNNIEENEIVDPGSGSTCSKDFVGCTEYCPAGSVGDWPNCHCAPDKTGTWPECYAIYCPPGTVGNYPNCKCAPGTTGAPPDCESISEKSNKPNILYLPVD